MLFNDGFCMKMLYIVYKILRQFGQKKRDEYVKNMQGKNIYTNN